MPNDGGSKEIGRPDAQGSGQVVRITGLDQALMANTSLCISHGSYCSRSRQGHQFLGCLVLGELGRSDAVACLSLQCFQCNLQVSARFLQLMKRKGHVGTLKFDYGDNER